MIEEGIKYCYHDYIDRIIPTNGWMFSADGIATFWTGYRVFIRSSLDEYPSVNDWINDNKPDILLYNHLTQYVYREYDDMKDVVRIGYEGTNSSDIGIMNKRHIHPSSDWMYEVVYFHKEEDLCECPFEPHILESKIDRISTYAQYESIRYRLNEMQYNKGNVPSLL